MSTKQSAPSGGILEKYDRRRYRRHVLSLGGRYMLESRREFACRTIDASADGMALAAPVGGRPGEQVIAYIDHLGRIEGHVLNRTELGFTMQIDASLKKRDRLAATLDWLSDRDGAQRDENRRHGRVIPKNPFAFLTMPDGAEIRCRILDLSMSGAALAVDAEPPVGAPVRLREINGRVTRHFAGGLAIEFTVPQSESTLEERF